MAKSKKVAPKKAAPKKAAALKKGATPKKAAITKIIAGGKGCCKIEVPGQDPRFYPNLTEARCSEIADQFPGATYDFTPGVPCP